LSLLCTPVPSTFTDPAPAAIYTLSLHDALPIFAAAGKTVAVGPPTVEKAKAALAATEKALAAAKAEAEKAEQAATHPDDPKFALDRKSTRLNSSHVKISYAVFCLKKKKKNALC